MIRKIASVVLVLFALSVMAGCRGTARGVGEDMEHAGEKIQEKAEDK
ncbi:MAG: entericidin A/B family lipoprotein [Alphaproteobacteria bacterium]|uniref:Entericidin A/B family lipoprotein n=1 Tax=Candidatus Nitrobium versatile TaxID=2884831 RepID=A0A953JA39_9BACT|nr:entericidin A/B family lipoprotein [Candidatus Nitrobium versatile]